MWALREGAAIVVGPGPWPDQGPIALDDAEAAAVTDERRLLHRLNEAAEGRRAVLLAARSAPARWPVALPDLASRLRATVAVAVGVDEALLSALLGRLLAERQLTLPAGLQDWLRLRLPRTPAAMREAAARLDTAALAAGGAVTRAVAARVAEEMAAEPA